MDEVRAGWRFFAKLPRLTREDVRAYWDTEGPKALFVVVWLALNAAIFIERAVHYASLSPGPYDVLGGGLVGTILHRFVSRCSG